MILNIIGNGFDLYHGLPSRYQDFAIWLIENDIELFENIGKYYDVDSYIIEREGADYEVVGYRVDDMFWSQFENKLGELNPLSFEDQLIDDLGLENEDPVSIIDEVDANDIAEDIKLRFSEWVRNTLDNNNNYIKIKRLIGRNKLLLLKTSLYVNFNYTHLLQRLYGIPGENIFYPHGECSDYNDQLVVGHGNSEIMATLKSEISSLEERYDYTQSSKNRIDEKTCELSFLKALRKESEFISRRILDFVNNKCNTIEQIVSFGFSFGDADIPYIKTLIENYPKASWRISYYKLNYNEQDRIKRIINECAGNKDTVISFFRFNNPNSNRIRDAIMQK